MRIRFEFKLEDMWIGVFWKWTRNIGTCGGPADILDVWVCLVPCLPLHITTWWMLLDDWDVRWRR